LPAVGFGNGNDQANLARPPVLSFACARDAGVGRVDVGGQNQDVRAYLGRMDAEPSEIVERAANAMVERAFANDKVEAGFNLSVSKWQTTTVARTVAADNDVPPHAPSASASPMICKIPRACS
jgi:hypothetical protein